MDNLFCSLCSSPLKTKLFAAPDKNDNNKSYSFYQCAGCDLIQIRPFPNKKRVNNFYSYMDADDHAKIKNQQINFLHSLPFGKTMLKKYIDLCYRQRYQLIIRLHPKGRIVDVGCGEGSFLKKFPPEKWERSGIEINKNLANIARRTVKHAKIITVPIEKAKLPKQKFEIITMWHVLEHIHNPKIVLKALKKLISPHGYLVIEVPHGNSLYRKLFSAHWQLLLLPQHIFFWTKKSIALALNDAGFHVIDILYTGIFNFSGSSSLANAMRSKGMNSTFAIFTAFIIFPLVIIVNLFSFADRDNMIIIAQLKKS